jgi:hypothetical protein
MVDKAPSLVGWGSDGGQMWVRWGSDGGRMGVGLGSDEVGMGLGWRGDAGARVAFLKGTKVSCDIKGYRHSGNLRCKSSQACFRLSVKHFVVILISYVPYFKAKRHHSYHGRMTRGGHGQLKVSPGPAMPNRPNGRFRGGPPAGQAACGRLLPLWTPMTIILSVAKFPVN